MGTRKLDGYGFRQNFKTVIGICFLTSVNIFHGYKFVIVKPVGFVPMPSLPEPYKDGHGLYKDGRIGLVPD